MRDDRITDEQLERGEAALTRFVFPGCFVPRREMAEAVLAAALDAGEDWMHRLPAKRVVTKAGES